jgi:hypothetical protein
MRSLLRFSPFFAVAFLPPFLGACDETDAVGIESDAAPSSDVEPIDAAAPDGAAVDATLDVAPPCIDTQSDAKNCGRCGRSCLSGSACTAGRCSPTAIADACPAAIAEPLEGGSCANMSPASLAVSGTEVFWGHYKGSSVLAAPKAGGQARLVALATQPSGIAVVGGRVFFAEFWGSRVTSTTLAGQSPLHIAGENGPHLLFVDGANAAWLAHDLIGVAPLLATGATHFAANGYVNDVVSDGSKLYTTNYDRKAIVAQPIAGGPATDFATAQGDVWCISATATELFWGGTDAAGKPRIMRAPKAGGAPTVFVDGVSGPLLVSGGALYYHDGSLLLRKDLSGGAPLVLARAGISTLVACRSIAVDDEAIYWADELTEKILRVAR